MRDFDVSVAITRMGRDVMDEVLFWGKKRPGLRQKQAKKCVCVCMGVGVCLRVCVRL